MASLRLLLPAATGLVACATLTSAAPRDEEAPSAPRGPMAALVERYAVDAAALRSFYRIGVSERRLERLGAFEQRWLQTLEGLDFESLDLDGKIDAVLLANHIQHRERRRELLRRRLPRLPSCCPSPGASSPWRRRAGGWSRWRPPPPRTSWTALPSR